MSDRVRVARLLIYEGPREWVETTVARSIQGTRVIASGLDLRVIRGMTLHDFPEVLPDPIDPRVLHGGLQGEDDR